MRPGNMARNLGAAMGGGHTPAPAAQAPAGAPADDFDNFLAQETAKIQAMAKARAKEKGIELETPAQGEEGQGTPAAAAKPPRNVPPSVIVWAGAHGEQKPPEGIRWTGPGGAFEIDRLLVGSSRRTPLPGAFDETVFAWLLEINPRRFTPDVIEAVIDEWIDRDGRDWEQCGGVIATGHPDLVRPLLMASIRRCGRPLVLPIKSDETMVDPVLYNGKTPRAMREGYKRRWMSRWQT